MPRFPALLVALLCVLGGAARAHADQSTAPLTGVVLDSSGAPVAGATITVERGGQPATTAQSAADGRFSIEAGSSSDATLRVRASGFADLTTPLQTASAPMRLVLLPAPLLESVTVTGSRGASGVDTAAATSVVTSAQLMTSAAGALDDALRNTPGFSLFRRSTSRVANPTTQGVTLRGVSGSGASRTLVVADGWSLNDPFGSWVYWNRIPIAAVDRVEVVRGATGDLYGADALGGVIQVLTLDGDRPRLRALVDAGSQSTIRTSGFGGRSFGDWSVAAGAEWQNTDGAFVIAKEDRGDVDTRANSDYQSGFGSVGYSHGSVHGTLRAYFASEDRGNGTPIQINNTGWRQVTGDVNGPAAGGLWTARITGGTQDYFQTFSAIPPDRKTERLTNDQTVPGGFFSANGQWMRSWKVADVVVGLEGRRTTADLNETRYSLTGVPTPSSMPDLEETNLSLYSRVRIPIGSNLSVVFGARGDRWDSGTKENFFSPRASVQWRVNDVTSLQFSVSRAYRTPTLNELYRGFRVGNVQTNANAALAPERLTGFEGGILIGHGRASARVTAFHNSLNNAISNVTVSTTPTLILRQRQNTDKVGSSGVEVEGDLRPTSRVTISLFGAFTSAHFLETPKQPDIQGNDIPQVPPYSVGAGIIAEAPRVATFSVQARFVGNQFEDDINSLVLKRYVVVDASATRPLTRAVQLFLGVENLFDVEYDVGRTPVRSIGWPFSARAGIRLFMP